MNKNFSLPRLNTIQITNRLNRLKARNKPRLQFPTHIESRKHFIDYNYDNIKFNNENNQKQVLKGSRRDKLDISDIEGTRPRMIQKQKNVLKYYQNVNNTNNHIINNMSNMNNNNHNNNNHNNHNNNHKHNHNNHDHNSNHDSYRPVMPRSYSQHQMKYNFEKYNIHNMYNNNDSLDRFQKQMQHKLTINPQTKREALQKRQITEPSYKLNSIIDTTNNINSKHDLNISTKYDLNVNNKYDLKKSNIINDRRNLFTNPTYMSSLILL